MLPPNFFVQMQLFVLAAIRSRVPKTQLPHTLITGLMWVEKLMLRKYFAAHGRKRGINQCGRHASRKDRPSGRSASHPVRSCSMPSLVKPVKDRKTQCKKCAKDKKSTPNAALCRAVLMDAAGFTKAGFGGGFL
jgi:hypothetical protein